MPSKPRKFCMVEPLQRRNKKGGVPFFRAAVLEEGHEKIVELYCRLEHKKAVEVLEALPEGAKFAGGPFTESSVSLNVTKDTKVK